MRGQQIPEVLGDQQRSERVDAEDLLEGRGMDLVELLLGLDVGAPVEDAGDVQEEIEAPVMGPHLGGGGGDARLVGHVEAQDLGARRGQLPGLLGPPAGADDGVPAGLQCADECEAEAAVGPLDECDGHGATLGSPHVGGTGAILTP
jgi:hypothetical protein